MKIVLTGPESSGKTSISKAIADHFDVQWFPEYAREYLLEREGKYDFDDIERIGVEQNKLREQNQQTGLKIYDTENTVLYIWSTFKFNKCAPTVKSLLENQRFTHYFLCSPEGIPWEEDPLRENPHQRAELFDLYQAQLQKQNVDFTVLKGDFEQRKAKAISIIEEISLSKGGFCV
ncbi:MAG TPA: ATP-binding protein [Brumimicrobium sp.]|nr:ATP-binding protein [Brumimicrobium sp.]